MPNKVNERAMSDPSILVSVEDLINLAMGPSEGNTVNFKIIQTILHILARQMRLLQTKVDLKMTDAVVVSVCTADLGRQKEIKESLFSESKGEIPFCFCESTFEGYADGEEEEVPEEKEKRVKKKEQQALEKMSPEEKETYMKQKEKEEKLMETMSPKEKERYIKEKERELNEVLQMSPQAKEKYFKEKDKKLNILEQMSPAEREKYFEEKESSKSSERKSRGKDKSPRPEKTDELAKKMSPNEKELYNKQKEREEKALSNMSSKEKEKYFAEKEKEERALEKMTPEERINYLEEKEQEATILDEMTPKEKEKYLKEKKKREVAKDTSSGTSIAVSEVERDNEKVLVVEKGPTTRRPSNTRVGSIEVVTRSEFELLRAKVGKLAKAAGPLPLPVLPDNKQLKDALVKGSASLTDTMQAMQVTARLQAAEKGLACMAGLLTQLAAAGALPETIAGQLENVKAEMVALRAELKDERSTPKVLGQSDVSSRKSVAISPSTPRSVRPGSVQRASSMALRDKRASSSALSMRQHSTALPIAITRTEMDNAMQLLREDMMKIMHNMTYRAASNAETAAGTAKAVSGKMEVAEKLSKRISDLHVLTTDYADQLSGFDAGLTTQMQSFREQMTQMREDLKVGLTHLDTVNNNAETAAVKELTDRYMGLQSELETTGLEHQRLVAFQKLLGDELKGLVETVETLKEQKADRDEVWDGLRDKAAISKLNGLLTEAGFAAAHDELDARLDVCYEKFHKQEAVWMKVMHDLNEMVMKKAELLQLLNIREETQEQLQSQLDTLRLLTIKLGEPKAAILARELSRDGVCVSCRFPAQMQTVAAGPPVALPAYRPGTIEEPCAPDPFPSVLTEDDYKAHICTRWTGGSHTLVPVTTPRAVAATPLAPERPVKRYAGYGLDGKIYKLEEELKPCVKCNMLRARPVKEGGAGDTAREALASGDDDVDDNAIPVCKCLLDDEDSIK